MCKQSKNKQKAICTTQITIILKQPWLKNEVKTLRNIWVYNEQKIIDKIQYLNKGSKHVLQKHFTSNVWKLKGTNLLNFIQL